MKNKNLIVLAVVAVVLGCAAHAKPPLVAQIRLGSRALRVGQLAVVYYQLGEPLTADSPFK